MYRAAVILCNPNLKLIHVKTEHVFNETMNNDSKNKRSWSEINKARKEAKRMRKEKALETEKIEPKTDTSSNPEPTATKELSTLSIAVPGSILENSQSPELRTYLCGQIARAACIFQVDEVVVFDDYADEANAKTSELTDSYGEKTVRRCCVQLGRILQYMECPQYLRKHFFPIHPDLKFCGILNPLNAPYHLTRDEHFEFREGIVTDKPVKEGKGSMVNVGLLKEVRVDKLLTPGLRCTVQMLPQENQKKLKGTIVSPSTPRYETGVYWGYSVRLANSIYQVFSQSPYKDGYDLTIGTSDKGTSVDEFVCPSYKHMLIMFGGLNGLEAALENDTVLDAEDPALLFDYYLNTLPNQGSKTLRTEEAILISLSALRTKLNPCNKPLEFINTIKTVIDSNMRVKGKTPVEPVVDDLSRFD